MKRIYILIAAAVLATGVQAQNNQKSNYLGFNLGAGMNTILYTPTDGSYAPNFGFCAGPQYSHFFGKHFGFGLGVQYGRYNATAKYNTTIIGHPATHPDNGLQYNPVAAYNNWNERQTLGVVSIPIELLYRTSLGKSWAFLLGIGAQFDMQVSASYSAIEGTFETQGYFPSTNVTYRNLPAYGFCTYNADLKGDVATGKNGVSVIADLGFNHSLNNNWGLYLGIYAGYGISNLYDDANANNDMISINSTDANILDYNSTIASDRVDAYNLLGLGVKVGINLGWNCKHGNKGDEGDIVPYASAAEAAAAERAAAEKAAAERAAAERAAAEKAAAERAAAEQAAAEAQSAMDKAAAEAQAAAERVAAEARAAEDAARQAQYANDASLALAMQNIDNDIAAAEQLANQSGSAKAKTKVNQAKAKANEAKEAYKNGRYADAYNLMHEAYALLADSYAEDADTMSKPNGNKEAADAAATYATAAHNGDLESAMAAMRNARINALKAAASTPAAGNNNDNNQSNNASNAANKVPMTTTDMANLQKYLDQINTGIHFNFNESTPIVSNGVDITLRAVAAAMAADNKLKVTCIGHTDSIGGEAYNQGLGLRRAKALKSLLVEYGAPARNINTRSCGKNEPVAPNDTEENRARNRRAVIVLQ